MPKESEESLSVYCTRMRKKNTKQGPSLYKTMFVTEFLLAQCNCKLLSAKHAQKKFRGFPDSFS